MVVTWDSFEFHCMIISQFCKTPFGWIVFMNISPWLHGTIISPSYCKKNCLVAGKWEGVTVEIGIDPTNPNAPVPFELSTQNGLL